MRENARFGVFLCSEELRGKANVPGAMQTDAVSKPLAQSAWSVPLTRVDLQGRSTRSHAQAQSVVLGRPQSTLSPTLASPEELSAHALSTEGPVVRDAPAFKLRRGRSKSWNP